MSPPARPAVLWLLAAALAQAASLWGQPAQYALGEIDVRGGNRIGDPSGIVFQRTFDPECLSSPQDPRLQSLSGFLDGDLRLLLQVISCPEGAPPPSAECRIDVAGLVRRVSFQGWTASLDVPLPAQTGIFPLRLACTFQDQPPETLETLLYMTWGAALPPVPTDLPVPASWYWRACSWGEGLGAQATEQEVVETLLAHLYQYGQTHWRYGYGLPGLSCRFCFARQSMPECECACDWTNLIDEESSCQSGDCFVFSAVLQNMAAMMGVVMKQGVDSGVKGLGLTTQPWLRSLDPEFPGNLDCGPRELPCSYLFPRHSFGELDGLKYDATFGAVYRSLAGLVDQNIEKELGGRNLLLERSVACYQGLGYGGWRFYDELPGAGRCPIDRDGPAELPSGPVQSEAVSTRGDSRPEVIGVSLEVELRRAGSYRVGGALYRRGRAVSTAPSSLRQFDSPEVTVSGEPGRYRVRLLFSAEEIVRAEITDPLTLHAWLAGEQGVIDTREAEVPPLPPAELRALGEQPARFDRFLDVASRLVNGSTLRIQVPVDVRETGDVILQAQLSCRGRAISVGAASAALPRGEHVLALEIPTAAARHKPEGQCVVIFALHWGNPSTPVDWLEVGVGRLRDSTSER